MDGRSPAEKVEADLSELRGLSYACIDGCALCCLCQPELLPDELERFNRDPRLSEGVSDTHISPHVEGAAIKLRGSHGACHFLRGRRCTIYGDRPHFCKLFPVNVFVGWRIQLNANLSCRGIGLPGEDLETIGRDVLRWHGDSALSVEVGEASAVFDQFVENTREARVAQSYQSVRRAADILMEDLTDRMGLSRVLTYAEHGSTRQTSPPEEMVRQARRTEPDADVEERAIMDGTELFDLEELSHLPVYAGKDLGWSIFKLTGGEIVGHRLEEDGRTVETSRTAPSDVELLPVDAAGRDAMTKYLRLMNTRDCFMGHAAHLCDDEDYEFNFGQVYMGAMATNTLDLWWRASFLARLAGREVLGADEVREGVIFFDMDLLDLPTIGAFI